MDLAKSINEESQEVKKIAESIAKVCTDKTMKRVSCSRISCNSIENYAVLIIHGIGDDYIMQIIAYRLWKE